MTTWLPPGPALLFCPADRPERYAKAVERADAVIIDLEDAVAEQDRPAAREHLRRSALDPERVIVRVNPHGSPDYEADLRALADTAYRCVMLAKTESGDQVRELHQASGAAVLALAETPLGVVRAAEIAAADGCAGLMWGSEDLVAGMGGSLSRFTAAEADPASSGSGAGDRATAGSGWSSPQVVPGRYRDVPRFARATVALAAAAFGRWMVDAVHFDIRDTGGLHAEASDAVALGFAATGCIHPAQVPVVRAAYAPSASELDWARRVLQAGQQHSGVFALDGMMIDGPVFRQAESTLRRARAAGMTTAATTPAQATTPTQERP
ncbi:MAG: HpcH/HpaI aldolase/citrate lyase family protein [Actinomycetales bacterium]